MDEPMYNPQDLSEFFAYHRRQAEEAIDARLQGPVFKLVQMSDVAFAYVRDHTLPGDQGFRDLGYARASGKKTEFDQVF